MANDEHTLLLGEIKGKLDALHSQVGGQSDTLSAIDERLRGLEVKAARHGALYGTLSAVGVSLIIEKLKQHIGMS